MANTNTEEIIQENLKSQNKVEAPIADKARPSSIDLTKLQVGQMFVDEKSNMVYIKTSPSYCITIQGTGRRL